MKLLLDTSVLLWSVAEDHKLNARAIDLLRSRTSICYLSSASAWEIAIKYALGRLPLHAEPEVFIPQVIDGMGMQTLDITAAHTIAAGRLPRHHEDPFDRMLIAQANAEGMTLLTADRALEKYKVEHIYCGR